MTDLRDKIAAVLYSRAMSRLSWHRDWGDLQPDVQQMWLDDADAVIREIGLRPERWKSDDPTMLRGHWTRFVTDWTHPDA